MGEDAIVALATPPGRGAIALIRLSGGDCLRIVRRLVPSLPEHPSPRRATLAPFITAGGKLDDCLATFFPAPNSYTGEDCVELTLHGNPSLVSEAQRQLIQAGARPARPGEFTWRALLKGKMDLLQAEAVQDLVAADSILEARLSFGKLEGRLSEVVAGLRSRLVDLGARLETALEFAEETSTDAGELVVQARKAFSEVEVVLASARFQRSRLRGLEAGIVGRVNAGKSTLFNALLLDERALTSPHPGTTRDVLRERLDLDGVPLFLTDAAGFAGPDGSELDQLGVQRSLDRLHEVGIVLLVVDSSRPLDEADLRLAGLTAGKTRLVVASKADLASPASRVSIEAAFADGEIAWVSALKGTGLAAVRSFLAAAVRKDEQHSAPYSLNDRQLQGFEHLRAVLGRLVEALLAGESRWELAAEELRTSLREIGRLNGTVDVDEVLATVFDRFCIGK